MTRHSAKTGVLREIISKNCCSRNRVCILGLPKRAFPGARPLSALGGERSKDPDQKACLPNNMKPYKHPSAQATSELAQRRVVAVLECLKVLCPSADIRTRRDLATQTARFPIRRSPPPRFTKCSRETANASSTRRAGARCWCSPSNYARN